MAELTIEQRLDRLEKYAQTQCWRCGNIVTFGRLYFIKYPTSDSEIALCGECGLGYEKAKDDEETRFKYALIGWLKKRCTKSGVQ